MFLGLLIFALLLAFSQTWCSRIARKMNVSSGDSFARVYRRLFWRASWRSLMLTMVLGAFAAFSSDSAEQAGRRFGFVIGLYLFVVPILAASAWKLAKRRMFVEAAKTNSEAEAAPTASANQIITQVPQHSLRVKSPRQVMLIVSGAVGLVLFAIIAYRIGTLTSSLTPREIYSRYANRVVTVQAVNSRSDLSVEGTGILWRNSAVLTNRHIIAQARKITVKRHDAGVWLSTPSADVEYSVWLSNKEQDWAVIIPTVTASGYNDSLAALPVLSTLPDVGEEVIVIGNPAGLTNSLSTGVVAGVRQDSTGDWIQITAAISPGSSGSPVFDIKGRLLGLATMNFTNGQNLNFAISIKPVVRACDSEPTNAEAAGRRGQLPLDSYDAFNGMSQWNKCDTTKQVFDLLDLFSARFPDPDDQRDILLAAAGRCDELGDYESAISVAQREVQLSPDDYDAWWAIARAQKKSGFFLPARTALTKAIALAEQSLTANEEAESYRVIILFQLYQEMADLEIARIESDAMAFLRSLGMKDAIVKSLVDRGGVLAFARSHLPAGVQWKTQSGTPMSEEEWLKTYVTDPMTAESRNRFADYVNTARKLAADKEFRQRSLVDAFEKKYPAWIAHYFSGGRAQFEESLARSSRRR